HHHHHHYPNPPTVTPASSEPAPPEQSNFCYNRRDGKYNIGCISFYIACVNRRAYAMECPNGLVFDTAVGECADKATVAVCGGAPTTQPQPPVTVPADVPSPSSPRPCIPHHKPGFCCTGRPDGYYSLGCSATYVTCLRGSAYLNRCGADFRFDVVTHQCVAKWYVRECGGRPQPSLPPATTTYSPPASEATTTTTTTPDFCAGRPDGAYNIGCSSTYFICIYGKVIFNMCSAPLVFDVETRQCRATSYVRACGGSPPASEPPSTQPPVTLPTVPPQLPPVRPCRHHHNGFFAIGCSSRFLSCLDGHHTYHSCRRGFVFNQATLTCIPREMVRPCYGYRPAEVGESY
ncbi:unnamed protein product, partial [Toxocara canis]|uniref:Chondroitin proteoglycan 2 n=1 Tax=Toxocara canis TaxID=6265 RepID=A0A183V8P3_TOXCA